MRLPRGFTLIELVVVLAVIAILATMAIPSHVSSLAREQVRESLEIVEKLKPSVEQARMLTLAMPEDNAAAGLPEPDRLLGNYITSIVLENGALTMTFGNKATSALKDKKLTVRAIAVVDSPASPVSWICGYSRIPDGMWAEGENRTTVAAGLLPVACRDIAPAAAE